LGEERNQKRREKKEKGKRKKKTKEEDEEEEEEEREGNKLQRIFAQSSNKSLLSLVSRELEVLRLRSHEIPLS